MDNLLNQELIDRVGLALKDLQYGSVHLILHEGRVVRIERVERIRLTGSPEALNHFSG